MKKHFVSLIMVLSIFTVVNLTAAKKNQDKVLREATGVWDYQSNTAGNFEFISNNSGIIGMDVLDETGTGYYPRGSQNKYLFGGGIWFGAEKRLQETGEIHKLVELTYNPNSSRGWFSPGRVEDGISVDSSDTKKYRIYFSTDINHSNGAPFNSDDGPAWALWNDGNVQQYHFGTYKYNFINDVNMRNLTANPGGPLFVSDEDIFSTYKDTDLNYYEGGQSKKASGYPLGLQVEQSIYSWNSVEMKDVVIISYIIENTSSDTLMNCFVGGVYDTDIGYAPDGRFIAGNDHARFYDEDPAKNLAIAWTDTNRGEAGRGFGYIGVSMIETPAISSDGFIRNDKLIYEMNEQIGLTTFRNWDIEDDINNDDDRYNFMSKKAIDSYDPGAGDKRLLLVTGPFNMLPGDKAHVAYAVTFAMPSKGGEADGTTEDLTGFENDIKGNDKTLASSQSLIGKLDYAESYYYNLLNSIKTSPEQLDGDVIYPNPAGEFIQLPGLKAPQDFIVGIYSTDGKKQIELPYSETINIIRLTPGAYFLKAGDKTYKFVKK